MNDSHAVGFVMSLRVSAGHPQGEMPALFPGDSVSGQAAAAAGKASSLEKPAGLAAWM